MTRLASCALTLLLASAACQPRPATPPPAAGPDTAVTSAEVDSIALERTLCFGTCPAYRVVLTREGAIHFRSLNPGDTLRVAADQVQPEAFTALVDEAGRMGFDRLPASIIDSPLCGGQATDFPSVLVTLFRGTQPKRVADSLGCQKRPEALRAFELRIDSVAGARRWARPSSRR
jgi:hypothetical protein